MRPRTLLILALAVLGLGAFIWLYERKLPGSEKRAELERRALPDFKKEDVSAIEIEAAQGTVRLERAKDEKKDEKGNKDDKADEDEGDEEAEAEETAEWRIVRPLAARADGYAVERLLSSLSTLEKTRTLDQADPQALGLDRPRATLRLVTKEGAQVLRLGAQVPTGPSLIAGLEGTGEAWVVSDSILSEVDRKPGDWRDHTMVHGDRDEVEQVRLTGASGPVVLKARKDGFWIESPIRDRADRDLVDSLLSDLFGLNAETFLDDPARTPESLGLAPPAQTVAVKLKGEASPILVAFGKPSEPAPADTPSPQDAAPAARLLPAKVGDAVFETRTRLAEAADRPAGDWRALGWSGLEVHQIDSATVKDDAGTLALSRADTDWKRGKVTISYLPVSDLLLSLTGARASRLLTAAEAAALGAKLDRPVITVTLAGKDVGTETLTLFAETAEGLPARAGGRDVVLLLAPEQLSEIRDRIRQVREAEPAEDAKDE